MLFPVLRCWVACDMAGVDGWMAPDEAQGASDAGSRLAGPECGACQMIVGPVGGVIPLLCVGFDTFLFVNSTDRFW